RRDVDRVAYALVVGQRATHAPTGDVGGRHGLEPGYLATEEGSHGADRAELHLRADDRRRIVPVRAVVPRSRVGSLRSRRRVARLLAGAGVPRGVRQHGRAQLLPVAAY